MKSISFFLLAAFVPVLAFAQEKLAAPVAEPATLAANLGTWATISGDINDFNPSVIEMTYIGDEFVEVRDNFDAYEAVTMFFGHRWKKDLGSLHLSFTGALGFIKYDHSSNLGFLTHTAIESKKWKLYTMNQYTGASSHDAFAMLYHRADLDLRIGKLVRIGASDQYREFGIYSNLDFGPSLGFDYKVYYAKAYAWDPWSESDRYYSIMCGIRFNK